MALSHKDWELPNSWIWLAEIDIESSLDFPSRPAFRPVLNVLWRKSCKLKCKIIDYFDLTIFILWKCQKTWWGKKIQFIQLCIYYVHVCTRETTRSLIKIMLDLPVLSQLHEVIFLTSVSFFLRCILSVFIIVSWITHYCYVHNRHYTMLSQPHAFFTYHAFWTLQGDKVVNDDAYMTIMFCSVLLCTVVLCYVVLCCDVMWCDVSWCDAMWCDVMLCFVKPHNTRANSHFFYIHFEIPQFNCLNIVPLFCWTSSWFAKKAEPKMLLHLILHTTET